MDIALWIGLALLALGLLAYVGLVLRRHDNSDANQHYGIAWFLVAIGGAVVMFWLFPGTPADGTLFGVKVGGVAAALLVIWVAGMHFASDGERLDRRAAEIEAHKIEVEAALQKRENEAAAKEAAARKAEADARKALDELKIAQSASKPERPLDPSRILYRVANGPNHDARVGIITGDLMRIKDVDIWVNSENTNMQMARYYEGTVSGMIRYYGAKRDNGGKVLVGPDKRLDDPIADELRQQVHDATVAAASVYVTGAGELLSSNNVKKIFHVAAVEGRLLPGTNRGGFRPVENLEDCVRAVLERVDSPELANEQLTSIVFPLLGTGGGKAELVDTAQLLIPQAVSYLARPEGSRLKRVYFVALAESHKNACMLAFDALALRGDVVPAEGHPTQVEQPVAAAV